MKLVETFLRVSYWYFHVCRPAKLYQAEDLSVFQASGDVLVDVCTSDIPAQLMIDRVSKKVRPKCWNLQLFVRVLYELSALFEAENQRSFFISAVIYVIIYVMLNDMTMQTGLYMVRWWLISLSSKCSWVSKHWLSLFLLPIVVCKKKHF